MRCASCGFPLSPYRKVCPRCRAEVVGKDEKSINAVEGTAASLQGGFGTLGEQAYLEPAQPQRGPAASSTWDIPATSGPSASSPLYQTGQEVYEQLDFNDDNSPTLADQLPFPGSAAPFASMTESEPQQPLRRSEPLISSTPLTNTPLPPTGWTPEVPLPRAPYSRNERNSSISNSFLASKLTPRFGFTIAGAFILTGMLLLIFVFLISLSLPLSSISSSQQVTLTVTAHAKNTPTTVNATVSPQVTASPTATASAQSGAQFIDNAQTASTINPNTGTATKVTSSFKVHQQIYVTFAVHASQSGAVCLQWFLNEKQFDSYQFPMDAISTSAYSYTTATAPGAGYVQIYWASKPDCLDKVLAQQVSFTVTA